MAQNLVRNFRAARKTSTPLLDIRTPDAAATVRTLLPALRGTTVLHLDLNGLMNLADKAPKDAIVFFEDAQMFLSEPRTAQAIWNLRDQLRKAGTMLVLLSSPGSALPPILAQDVLVLDEPLPAEIYRTA